MSRYYTPTRVFTKIFNFQLTINLWPEYNWRTKPAKIKYLGVVSKQWGMPPKEIMTKYREWLNS